MTVGIIDYHLNNLRSVQKAFENIGTSAFISDKAEELATAEKLVLPGVGAFGAAMKNLRELQLLPVLQHHVALHKPLLGICLGMQLLFTKSFELGEYDGLNFIEGTVEKFSHNVKVPHIGWNQLEFHHQTPMLRHVNTFSFAYFVHSYYVVPNNAVTIAETTYGTRFASIVQQKNVVGIQFHPEKSQEVGLQFLKNFMEVV